METDAVVRYLVKQQRIPVRQIAAVAQQNPCGDAGFAGVQKAVRTLSASESAIVRFNDKRNTSDLDDAVNQLKAQTVPIKAVVMVPNYRSAAAKFIEKTRDLFPGMIYTTDVPGAQGTAPGPQLDTEKLTDVLANTFDLALEPHSISAGLNSRFRPRFGETPLEGNKKPQAVKLQ